MGAARTAVDIIEMSNVLRAWGKETGNKAAVSVCAGNAPRTLSRRAPEGSHLVRVAVALYAGEGGKQAQQLRTRCKPEVLVRVPSTTPIASLGDLASFTRTNRVHGVRCKQAQHASACGCH